MGESIIHIELVKLIKDYLVNNMSISSKLILTDLPNQYEKPIIMSQGFRPDVYFRNTELLVIGEAKTSRDLKRKHSLEQYNSYLMHCSLSGLKAKFIIAVEWEEYITAKNLMRKLKNKYNYNFDILVLNNMGSVEKV